MKIQKRLRQGEGGGWRDSTIVADETRGAMRFNKIPYIYSGSGKGLHESEVQRRGILSRGLTT